MERKMEQEKLAFETKDKGNHTVISMIGDLDLHSLQKAKDLVQKLVDSKKTRIIFDLERVNYIDTSGLGFFLGTLRKLKDRQGDMRLVNPNAYISGIFNLINLNKMIDIYDDLAAAEKGF